MSQIVYKWEVYCTTQSVYRYVFSDVEPTTCPDNNTHSISTNPGPRIIDTISSNRVKIIEEDGSTGGIYKFRGYKRNIPSGTPGNVTTFTHTWQYPITLINGWFMGTDEMKCDTINMVVAANTIVGAITAPVYTGNTLIHCTSTVLDNVEKGYYVNVTNGVTVNDLGECIAKDIGNSTITVSNSAVNNFSPLSPTYVRMSVGVIDNFEIPVGSVRYAFAEKKVGGKYLPAGVPTIVKYTNNTGNAKVFAYNMEYLY